MIEGTFAEDHGIYYLVLYSSSSLLGAETEQLELRLRGRSLEGHLRPGAAELLPEPDVTAGQPRQFPDSRSPESSDHPHQSFPGFEPVPSGPGRPHDRQEGSRREHQSPERPRLQKRFPKPKCQFRNGRKFPGIADIAAGEDRRNVRTAIERVPDDRRPDEAVRLPVFRLRLPEQPEEQPPASQGDDAPRQGRRLQLLRPQIL